MTFILGLTGSIGMGKSTTAAMFRAEGVPVHDADAAVHELYSGEAVTPVAAAFPGVVRDGRIDRSLLSTRVLGQPTGLERLEKIVHPLVRARENAFLEQARTARASVAVLDVPLLFETGAQTRCNAVLVVTAPEELQRQRVLARPDMTTQKLDAILARQMPDAQKRQNAHFIVDTSHGVDVARGDVRAILRALAACQLPARTLRADSISGTARS